MFRLDYNFENDLSPEKKLCRGTSGDQLEKKFFLVLGPEELLEPSSVPTVGLVIALAAFVKHKNLRTGAVHVLQFHLYRAYFESVLP